MEQAPRGNSHAAERTSPAQAYQVRAPASRPRGTVAWRIF
jgi:hypothetical protein